VPDDLTDARTAPVPDADQCGRAVVHAQDTNARHRHADQVFDEVKVEAAVPDQEHAVPRVVRKQAIDEAPDSLLHVGVALAAVLGEVAELVELSRGVARIHIGDLAGREALEFARGDLGEIGLDLDGLATRGARGDLSGLVRAAQRRAVRSVPNDGVPAEPGPEHPRLLAAALAERRVEAALHARLRIGLAFAVARDHDF
jgi:hypothetical protein